MDSHMLVFCGAKKTQLLAEAAGTESDGTKTPRHA